MKNSAAGKITRKAKVNCSFITQLKSFQQTILRNASNTKVVAFFGKVLANI
jgi:hypothetical protein